VIVIDSSVIYAVLDARDRLHEDAREWLQHSTEPLATTPLVLAEVDHLAAKRVGRHAATAFRRDVRAGAYHVEWWRGAEVEAAEVADRYGDLGLGLTDAALVALAARLGTDRIATFDERHFRNVRTLGGGSFILVSMDGA